MPNHPNRNPPPTEVPTVNDVEAGASLPNVQTAADDIEALRTTPFGQLFRIRNPGDIRLNPTLINVPDRPTTSYTPIPNFARRLRPITVASALPPTVYRDVEDQGIRNADGTTTPRSLGYISVQRSILAWLSNDRNLTDQVTPAKLHSWTYRIEPANHPPTAQEALSLCYYMRQLGFDTYSRLDPAAREVRLYLSNPQVLSTSEDTCYWHQTMGSTILLSERDLDASVSRHGHGRRAAISAEVLDELLNSQTEIQPRSFLAISRDSEVLEMPDMSRFGWEDLHTDSTPAPYDNGSFSERFRRTEEEFEERVRGLMDQLNRASGSGNGFSNENSDELG